MLSKPNRRREIMVSLDQGSWKQKDVHVRLYVEVHDLVPPVLLGEVVQRSTLRTVEATRGGAGQADG